MADHLWFIPVTGGSRRSIESVSRPGYGGSDDTNVQWDFSVFPVNVQPRPDIACINMSSYNTFIQGDETPTPAKLSECYGSWTWRSCATGDPLRIVTGGQLMVGTVFSRTLDLFNDGTPPVQFSSLNWNRVDAWVKFRVIAANINVLSSIFFTINDRTGNIVGLNAIPRNWIANVGAVMPNWFVAQAFKIGNWTEWDVKNLRAVLSVQGTTIPANVGLVTVDVEWFAFRLSDQVL